MSTPLRVVEALRRVMIATSFAGKQRMAEMGMVLTMMTTTMMMMMLRRRRRIMRRREMSRTPIRESRWAHSPSLPFTSALKYYW